MKRLGALLLPLDGVLVHHRIPSMKRLGALLLPLDGMLVHHRVPSMKRLGELLLPLDGMLVHHRVPSMKRLGELLLLLDAGRKHCVKCFYNNVFQFSHARNICCENKMFLEKFRNIFCCSNAKKKMFPCKRVNIRETMFPRQCLLV